MKEIFSRRQKRLRGEINDLYVYDIIPDSLRIQIIYILVDVLGEDDSKYPLSIYAKIYNKICRELGLKELGYINDINPGLRLKSVIEHETSVEKVLDTIEVCFSEIENLKSQPEISLLRYGRGIMTPIDGIKELNRRFKENGIGYYFQSGELIRVDSTYMHTEVTLPVLDLVSNSNFLGANEEYLSAQQHYRHGRNKECLMDCAKAFESVLKSICTIKGWSFDDKKDTSSKLIDICFQNGLIPAYAQNQFTSLKQLLITGIPTIRNRTSGHGQGVEPQEVDDEIVRYGLNLTGSNIIFLIEMSRV